MSDLTAFVESLIRPLVDAHLKLVREHEALKTRVANMIQVGKVTDSEFGKGVRIQRGGTDEEPHKSPWMQNADASGNTSYLPRTGEQVMVIAPNGDMQQAVVRPFTHSDEKKDPAPDGDTTVHFNRDGLKSTTKKGAHSIETEDTVTIKAKNKIILQVGDATYTLDSSGHVFKGDKVKHDDKNIGKDHRHGGVMTGSSNTDVPSV